MNLIKQNYYQCARIVIILVIGFFSITPSFSQNSWTLTNPSSKVIRDMESRGRDLFAVGDQGLILKRNGSVETIFNPGVTTNFKAVTLIGTNTILAVGADKVARSTDGGSTWSVVTISGSPSLMDIIMQNTTTGWVVGLAGKIFKTTDGGATWIAQTSNTTNALNSVTFSGSFAIAVGANRTVCRSSNGGTTWTVTTPGSGTRDFRSIGGIAGDLFAVGNNGWILKSIDDGATWSTLTSGSTANLNKVTSYYDASVNNGTGCCPNFGLYACGDGGVLLRSVNHGTSWVSVPSGRTDDITAIEGLAYYEGPGATLSGGDIFLTTVSKGIMRSRSQTLCFPISDTAPSNFSVCIGDNLVIPEYGIGDEVATRTLKKNGVVVDFDGNTDALTTMTFNNIQPSQAGTYTIEVTNRCYSGASNSFTITVNDVPAMPSVITGSATPTRSILTPYSVVNVVGNTYAWSGGTGALISPSGNTASISWFPNPLGSKTITVTPTNACGSGPSRTLDVIVQPELLSPSFDATNVPVNTNLTIAFGSLVALTNTEIISIIRNSDNSVFETYTIPSSNVTTAGGVVTINPTASFEYSVAYRVQIDTRTIYNQVGGINSYYPGGTLGSNATIFRFTTAAAADVTPPTISSYSPVDNATGVAVTSNLIATFSENVTAVATKTVSIRLSSDNSVFESYTLPHTSVVVSGATVTINPTGSLANSTGYYVNVDVGAFEDAAGNDFLGITNAATWNFTTAAPADVIPPTISSLSPLNNATGVAVTSNLVATFSENITAVATKTISIRRASDNALFESYPLPSPNVVVSGTTVTINPNLSLTNLIGYYVNIEAGAFEDAAGNDFAGITNTTSWSFTTAAVGDVTPPSIVSLSPADNSINVPVSSSFVITFDENVSIANTTSFRIRRVSNNAADVIITSPSPQVTVSGNMITINPDSDLPLASTDYWIEITSGVSDLSNNFFSGISTNTTWNFTTAAVAPQNQTITFNALAAKTFGDAAFALTATASSGLPVSYASSNTAVATVSGGVVSIVGVGSTTITASQAGNGSFNPAPSVQQTLTVNKANQTITFGALAATTFGDANFSLGATASSALGVSYSSSNPAVATVSGNTVTIVGAGSTTITASQSGNTNYNAAASVQQVLTVNKASQTISFSALAAKTFGDANFSLGATASSALSVSYASSNPSVATISGNTVTIVGAGSTIITASQAGNTNYNAAADVQQTLTVNKASQTISFSALAAKTFGDANFSLGATASSTLGVSYASSNPAAATISNNTVTIVGAGSTIITASQVGNANYNAAANVQQTLTVNKANQIITFNALPGKQVGDAAFGLTATASSGLTLSYASSNTAVATISGSTVTIVGAGSTTITASQSGNTNFNAAASVQQTLTVTNAAPAMAIQSLTPVDNATEVDGSINLSITFNQNVDIGTGTISILRSDNDALVTSLSNFSGAITISGATATFNFPVNLPAGTGVYVNISAGYLRSAADASNTLPGISNKTTWNFTVGKLDQTITFNSLAAKTFGNPNFDLTAAASSGLPITYSSSNTSVATISGSTVMIVGAGSTTITASQSGNSTFNAATSVQQLLTVNKANQTISFSALDAKTFGDANFALSATTSSGLAVTFSSSNTSVATVSGNTVTILNSGSATITASQSGNANFNAAATVQQTLTVNKAPQTISFSSLAVKTFGDASFIVGATASSGLAVTFTSSNTSIATVSGNTITLMGAGSTVITASQAGNSNFNAAANVQQTLVVNKADQTITFSSLQTKTFGDAAFGLSASASSALAVSYSSNNSSVATVSGNIVTIVGAGSTTITASQGGNANINSAPIVQQTLTVNKANQTISFTAIPAKQVGDPAFNLTATSSSGLPIIFTSSNTAVATLSGSSVTIVGAGSSTMTATQAGNVNYNAASAERVLTVSNPTLQNQTITFNALLAKTFGDAAFAISATASSGLPVTFGSSNTSVATISGNTVTIIGAGVTTITAQQSGNSTFNAAPVVQQTLTVNKAAQTLSFATLPIKTFGDALFTLSATSSAALPVSFSSSNTAVATVSGSTVTIVGAGSTIISATQGGDANYNAATAVNQSLTVNKATQTITFGSLVAKNVSDPPFSLNATASSGLTVTYTSSNLSVATVIGSTVTIVGQGTTTITASQNGNSNYSAASNVSQILTVSGNTTTRVISLSGDMTFGNVIIPNTLVRPLTISNAGNSSLEITQINVPARYSVDVTTGTIAPGNTLVVNITFAPDAPKPYDGVINITSNATAGINQIAVTGVGALVTALEDDPAFRKSISVYPNPGKDVFMIEAPSLTSLHSIIVDGAGRVVLEADLFEKSLGNYELNLLDLNQGLYYIQLTTDSGIKTIRILKL
jgi:photosystem II stability/assembly factor-like uncharacterized protein